MTNVDGVALNRLIHTGLQPGARTERYSRNHFNGFRCVARETVKTVSQQHECFSTGLKPGVNEKDFSGKANIDRELVLLERGRCVVLGHTDDNAASAGVGASAVRTQHVVE